MHTCTNVLYDLCIPIVKEMKKNLEAYVLVHVDDVVNGTACINTYSNRIIINYLMKLLDYI